MSVFTDPEHELEPEKVSEVLGDDGWQVVDVREGFEREAGHLAGTRHIEIERLAGQAETIDRDRPVVFYCRLGTRSAMAAEAFRTAGYEAYTMAGGITAWAGSGLPLEPEDGYVAEH